MTAPFLVDTLPRQLIPGPAQVVNTEKKDEQTQPAILALADGGWVVAWQSRDQDGDQYGIYMQRYDANGSPSGSETRVNTTTLGNQETPVIASDQNNGWTIYWIDSESSRGFSKQSYNALGSPLGNASEVTNTEYNSISPSQVATLANGVNIEVSTGSDSSGAGIELRYNIPSLNLAKNEAFYQPIAKQFNDIDPGDVLKFTVTGTNGAPKPIWLSIDMDTGILSGTAPASVANGFVLVEVVATDTTNATARQTVAIYVGDSKGTATITGTNTASIGEDQDGTVSGDLDIADNDGGQSYFQAVTNQQLSGLYGTFTFNRDNGKWTYDVDSALPAVQALGATSPALEDKLTVKSVDGSAATTIKVTITGRNDAPTGAGTQATFDEEQQYFLVGNQFQIASDPEGNGLGGIIITELPAVGALKLNGQNVDVNIPIPVSDIPLLSYTPPKDLAGTPAASFKFKVYDNGSMANGGQNTDPTIRTFTFNITNVPDNADITGIYTADIGEDDTGTVGETLKVVDPDASEATFEKPDKLTGTHGTFFFDQTSGDWTYDVNNESNLVQRLGEGDTLKDYLTVYSFDNSKSQQIEVTIKGRNDSPTGIDSTINLIEDQTYTLPAALFGIATDPEGDTLQAVKITTLPTAGTLKLNNVAVTAGQVIAAAQVSLLTYQPPEDATGDNLASFTFQVIDDGGTANGGTNTDLVARTITFSVTGVADPAAISGVAALKIGEDQAGNIGGQLVVTDPDKGQNGFQAVAATMLAGKYGAFTFDQASGAWTYDVNSDLFVVQKLSAGQTLADTLDVQSIDGVKSTITVTIDGVDEPAYLLLSGKKRGETLVGTVANEQITGKGGKDSLTGGGGNDLFVFSGKFGKDTITDFDATDKATLHDIINVSKIRAITDFADLMANHVRQVDTGVAIKAGANMITLTGVALTDLTNDDFLF